MRKVPLESAIERRFVSWCAEQGLLQTKLHKNGWPDRQIFLGVGYSFFIEFKRPGEKPTALQLWIHKLLKERGYHVYVCCSREEAIEVTKGEIRSQETSQERNRVPGKKKTGHARGGSRSRKDDDPPQRISKAEGKISNSEEDVAGIHP